MVDETANPTPPAELPQEAHPAQGRADGYGPDHDRPAVQPPTAGFMVQLFLIPGLIVCAVVGVYLLFGRMAGGYRSPDEYLAMLRDSNHQRRRRAAFELALELPHRKRWQRDRKLAAALGHQLLQGLKASDAQQQGDTQYQEYLAAALGLFQCLDGLPALGRAAAPDVATRIRKRAILSIGQLGHRLGGVHDQQAVEQLVQALSDRDPELRRLAAFALGTVGGRRAVTALSAALSDSDRSVRYNAAAALARSGSTAGFDVLRQMLDFAATDPSKLPPEQRERPEAVPLAAIESLSELLKRAPHVSFQPLVPALQHAAQQGLPAVRVRAKQLLYQLQRDTAP